MGIDKIQKMIDARGLGNIVINNGLNAIKPFLDASETDKKLRLYLNNKMDELYPGEAITNIQKIKQKKPQLYAQLEPLRIPINQGHLINQMIRFHRLNQQVGFADRYAKKMRKGLCAGFAICYLAMAAVSKLQWWFALLRVISVWEAEDGECLTKFEQLKYLKNTIINLPQQDESQTLFKLLLRFFDYVIYNHGVGSCININGMNQNNFLKYFSCIIINNKAGHIKRRCFFRNISRDELKKRIIPCSMLATQSGYSYIISDKKHSCGLRFKESYWFFYDPNSKHEKCFDNINKLLMEIKLKLTSKVNLESFAIEGSNIDISSLNFTMAMITQYGLSDVTMGSYDNVIYLIEQAKTNKELRGFLCQQLYRRVNPKGKLRHFGKFKHSPYFCILYHKIRSSPILRNAVINTFTLANKEIVN